MKRLLAFLLAAVLVLSCGLTAYATGLGDTVSGGDSLESVSGDNAFYDVGSGLSPRIQAGQSGQVDVCIGAALILESPVTFTVELTDPRGQVMRGEIVLGADETQERAGQWGW